MDQKRKMHTAIPKTFIFLTFALIPFLGGNHLALYYVNVDRFWLETVFGLFLMISALLVHFGGGARRSDFKRFLSYFLPFFLLNVLSLVYTWSGFRTLLSINILVWAAGCVYVFLTCRWKEACLFGLVTGAGCCALSAIVQHLVLFPNLKSAFQQGMYAHILKEQSSIPFSSYSHHNMLGGYLAIIFPVAIYFVVSRKNVFSLIASVLASVLMIAGVILSSTRIGLGLVILCVSAAVIFLAVAAKEKRGITKIGGVAILAIILSFALLQTGGKQKGSGVQGVIAQKTKAVYKDLSTLNTRTDIWKNSLRVFRNEPLLGVGPGGFEYGYRKYFDGGSYTIAAHSVVVKTAVELGIAGLLCFSVYIFGVALGVRRRLVDTRGFFVLLAASSSLLFTLFDFSFDVFSHVITFFVLTSYFFTMESAEAEPVAPAKGMQKGLPVFLAMIICLLCASAFNTKLGLYRTDMEQADFMQENGAGIQALNLYRGAMGIMPLCSDAYAKASMVLVEAASKEKNERTRNAMAGELREYLRAMEKMGDKSSERFFSLGLGLTFLGEQKKADSYFAQTLKLLSFLSVLHLRNSPLLFFFGTGRKSNKRHKGFRTNTSLCSGLPTIREVYSFTGFAISRHR